jgi:hypothetical protein
MDADRRTRHPGPEEAGGTHIVLRLYAGSLSVPEHKSMRDAVDAASVEGEVTWLDNSAGAPVAAIVPRGIAELGIRAWEEERKRHA